MRLDHPAVEPAAERDPDRVRRTFSGIARRYDLLNRLLSLGLDASWRRRAVRELPADPSSIVLDLCTGTGDVAAALLRSRRAGHVIGCDFAIPMLRRAQRKLERIGLGGRFSAVAADALRLPFADESFDGATVAFGVRNYADRPAGFREALRVLRPGARLVILEFAPPEEVRLGPLYRFYLERVLPFVGDRVSGRPGPYGYLAQTIGAFPTPPLLAGMLREAGFAAVGWSMLSFGIVALHTAVKGGPSGR